MPGSINPIQDEFINDIANLNTRVKSLERAVQQNWIDWFSFNVSQYTYSGGDNAFTFAGATTGVAFQVGDRVRVTQGGGYKYFNVMLVTNDMIPIDGTQIVYVNAGSDYTLTSDPITTLGLSRLIYPSGFPKSFNFTSTLATAGGTISVQGDLVATYSLLGNVVQCYYERTGFTLATATSSGFYEQLPYQRGEIVPSTGIWQPSGLVRIGIGPFMDSELCEITKWDFTNFATGSNYYMNFGLTYTLFEGSA